MLDEKQKLTEIINLSQDVMQVKDLDILLEMILTKARNFVNADAGSIYIKEGDRLKFKYTQNETKRKKLPPGKKLIYSTFSIPIDNRSISGHVANSGKVLNIPDVYHLPEDLSFSFDKQYDKLSGYRTQSMLTFPLKTHRGDVMGVLQLINAQGSSGNVKPFAPEDEPFILHFANNAAVAIERAEMTRAIILRMIKMAELRDPKETGPHVNRVASYSVEIYDAWASKSGIPREEIDKHKDVLRMAAMLHDVGKVAISDAILKKPARLEPEEYNVMKQHTYLGARLFSDVHSEFDEASFIVSLNHHERWDGNGYPGYIDPLTGNPLSGYEAEDGKARGKKGEEIHPFGRVVAVADVYDALLSKRAYKQPWDESMVLEELKKESGKQFDPGMVDAMLFSLDVIKAIAERYPDD
jgi:HD-GYP domain-containing protein (c-di-GMP phosphodiesterase class II)